MLDTPSNTDMDSSLISDSNSFSSAQSHSDDQNQDIDSAPSSPIDPAQARFLFTRGTLFSRYGALRDERVVIFSKRTDPSSGQMQLFSIVRDDHYCYFGWFVDIKAITGIGYLFNGDGSYYRGEFVGGEKNGYGEFYYENGSHYNGFWRRNIKQGNGRFYFNKELYYIGKWDNNKMIECELQFLLQISDSAHVYQYMSSNNDHIFFKQSQFSTHRFY